jgi:hypothetical protein
MTGSMLTVKELGPGASPPEIGEEQLQQDQGRVRWLLVQRYEEVWGRVQARIEDDKAEVRPIDPRFLEIGLRAAKEVGLLYRLARPQAATEEEEDPVLAGLDRAAVVAEQLHELEAKQQAAEATQRDREQAAREQVARRHQEAQE